MKFIHGIYSNKEAPTYQNLWNLISTKLMVLNPGPGTKVQVLNPSTELMEINQVRL